MKIGIDLDGVVFDSEQNFRVYEELFDIECGDNSLVNREEPKFQSRYDWSKEKSQKFIDKYFLEISKTAGLMVGFKTVYERLKNEGHTFIAITARGGFLEEMKTDAERMLHDNGIEFDNYYWKQDDKLQTCLNEHVDVMIDDDYKIITKLSENGVKTLYFRDVSLKKLPESEFVYEVNNWGDIYRYIINNK